ncbi:conserved hypothetical protein [Candidatus Terasakiella magnetica]|uniref:Uncharacterized protein n=1 Tax=Candidatus Terasakiella magnetica TaxID=1867952 RepID=A0A1C3RIS1_9PROT|nr:hypothetical protein [Candidatus Terasakiella magnetica]SCA57160.1 conserved hypothetical protein [Candidatus Terasakiella magnetica]
MTDAVEIYICKPGQKIEEGQMVMSNDIDCKEAAEEDAKKRCKIVPSTERIVYYDVSGGGFKVLYSYTNPKVSQSKGKRSPHPMGGPIPKKKKAPAKKQGLWQKVKKSLGV